MNKHLLSTKMKSIGHYTDQINQLIETIKINEDVRKDLLQSLIEFFPWESGDILYKDEKIIKVEGCKSMDANSDFSEAWFRMDYKEKGQYDSWGGTCSRSFTIDELLAHKKVN